MKPKNTLKIIVFVLVLISISFGFIIYLTFKDYKALVATGEKVDKMKTDVFQRRLVANDYILYKNERPKEQWKIKQAEIDEFLNYEDTVISQEEHRVLLTQIADAVAVSQEIFDQVIGLVESGNGSSENLTRLTSQLTLKAQETISLASELSREISLKEREALQSLVLLLSILFSIYILFLVISFYGIWRSVGLLQVVDEAKDEFVSLASHQLRTPLTAIRLYSEMILKEDEGKLNATQKEYMDIVHESTLRMITLVGDILNVSRIQLGSLRVDPEMVSLQKLINAELEEVEPLARAKGINITSSLPESELIVAVDVVLFNQIVHNLLTNAIRYSHKDGTVAIALNKEKDGYHISVKDSGIGIPDSAKDKIFDRFYRADNAIRAEGEGTGLGLYMVKEIIDLVGGKLWFESVENKGTTFHVIIGLPGMVKKLGTKKLS